MSEFEADIPIDLPDGSVQVLILDRHPLTRIGLGVVLHRQPWVARCLLATGREEAIRLATRHRPDVAVVDVSDAGAFAASYLAPLRAARPAMPLVLASFAAPASQAQLIAAGRAGLLTADLSVDELIATVRAALVGDELSPPLDTAEDSVLSEREREVLTLLCTGATNREIAAAMHVGPETVKKHAASVYRKLGVRNRTEAARLAAGSLVA